MRTFCTAVGLAMILFGTFAPGGTEAEDAGIHQVVPGDTLWDISAGRLSDPFLWPALWQYNPEIRDPDLIYPDQTVRIPPPGDPVFMNAAGGEDKPMEQPPARATTTAGIHPDRPAGVLTAPEGTLRAGYAPPPAPEQRYLALPAMIGEVTEKIPDSGQITATVEGNALAGKNDAVILELPDAIPGDRYGIYRDMGRVRHPETRRKLGHLVTEVGVLTVESADNAVVGRILNNAIEIIPGDLLGPVPERPQVPLPGTDPADLGVTGTVVALGELHQLASERDVVYLDIGENRGVSVGTRLIITDGGNAGEPIRRIGELIVVQVTAETASAVVSTSVHEIEPGNRVSAPL